VENETKLTQDLGQAASELQQVLKSSQEELDEEKNLPEQIQDKVHY